ncbi:MAG: RNase adapter RapZ [Thermodesulfobacteriota bacterium]|nr:RNase adapter RapZ [Thermodesulfobacteriota bacterium]
MQNLRLVVITGLSGSGKSTAIKSLEDMGFFCVDNIPTPLIPKFIELCEGFTWEINRVAMGIDIRERNFLEEFPLMVKELKKADYKIEVFFLDCEDEILERRYNETRRQHPLAKKGSVKEGIIMERKRLSNLKSMADTVIDTSIINVHQLQKTVKNYFKTDIKAPKMSVNLVSFGYRHGIPYNADIVLDVRFLPNPYFIEGLKHLNGKDKKVSDYVLNWEITKNFIEKIKDFINFLIPHYEKEGKTYLTLAFGCTGGRHRSVAIVNEIKKLFDMEKYLVNIMHRDIDKK